MATLVPRITTRVASRLPTWLVRWVRSRRALHQFKRNLKGDDVFLVGHPKSGNTWLAFMLAVLVNKDRDGIINIGNVGRYIPTIHHKDDAIAEWGELVRPRIFRNEFTLYPLLYPKTIYIVRDPRSVLVSYYHHCVHDTRRNDWAIADFVHEMLEKGTVGLEPLVRWDKQVEQWVQRSNAQAVHFVRYEDLKRDPKDVLSKILNFIGLSQDGMMLDLAVSRGSFDRMRADERAFGAESWPAERGARGFFVRKGEIEGWRDELGPELAEQVELRFGWAMKHFGYLV